MFRWLAALAALSLAACASATSQQRYTGPIIDMHLHAFPADANGPPGQFMCPGMAADLRYDPKTPWPVAFAKRGFHPTCNHPIAGAKTDAENRDETIAALRRNNAIGVLSGSEERVKDWMAKAPGLFIPGVRFSAKPDEPTADQFRKRFEKGQFKVFAEVTAQYYGIFADDPRLAPYWKMAADLDIPVGIHIGSGPPGATMLGYPDYAIQNPLHLEPILRKYPKLRIYAMHAGFPFAEEIKALMLLYPQLYVDTGILQVGTPRKDYYAFLKDLVRAGFADRIMFGSDQMTWPGLIDEGIAAINDAPFLTYEQKKMILHDNAARFLRLDEDK
ncbi:MAG: amidohydrolase family protein [Alphaproteobacteria bacterium]|nr:amidohydrolase family protein [Alphaproteobacteria bacterium]